jgi:hypothetical protein
MQGRYTYSRLITPRIMQDTVIGAAPRAFAGCLGDAGSADATAFPAFAGDDLFEWFLCAKIESVIGVVKRHWVQGWDVHVSRGE